MAYEETRMTRELFRDGVIVGYNTGYASNGGPPLAEPSLKIPAVETYADVTCGGEPVFGEGCDWAYPKYMPSQFFETNHETDSLIAACSPGSDHVLRSRPDH